jgi:hypothetical protein
MPIIINLSSLLIVSFHYSHLMIIQLSIATLCTVRTFSTEEMHGLRSSCDPTDCAPEIKNNEKLASAVEIRNEVRLLTEGIMNNRLGYPLRPA